jgi:hypothetical protein
LYTLALRYIEKRISEERIKYQKSLRNASNVSLTPESSASKNEIEKSKLSSSGNVNLSSSSAFQSHIQQLKDIKLSDSLDLRPVGVTEREWIHLQIEAIKKELDKLLLLDALSLVDLNYSLLFTEMEEKIDKKDDATSELSSLVISSYSPQKNSSTSSLQLYNTSVFQKEKQSSLYSLVNALVNRGIIVNTENEEEVVLYTKKLFSSLFSDFKQKMTLWSEERFRLSSYTTQLISENLSFKLINQKKINKFLSKDQEIQKQMIRRRVQSDVAEKACNFVFEIERLKNILLKLVKVVDIQDVTVRKEVEVLFFLLFYLLIFRVNMKI